MVGVGEVRCNGAEEDLAEDLTLRAVHPQPGRPVVGVEDGRWTGAGGLGPAHHPGATLLGARVLECSG